MLKFNKKIQTIAHDYSFEKGTGQYIKENLPYFKKSLEAFPHYKLENEDDILDKIIGLAIIFTEYSNRKKYLNKIYYQRYDHYFLLVQIKQK